MKAIRVKPSQIAFVLIALSVGGHLLLTRDSRIAFTCYACAGCVFLVGLATMTWAWALFRRRGTPIRPTDAATALVTDGPYRLSRNPMYLGIVLMLLALAWGVGTLPMLIGPVGFFLVMSVVFIPYEEQRLQALFGETYAAYTRRVRRWL